MNTQQQRELLAIIEINISEFYENPNSFVPSGTEMLSDYEMKIFEEEMDRVYRRHERDSLIDEVYQDGTHFCD
jgi:hypothetical protein